MSPFWIDNSMYEVKGFAFKLFVVLENGSFNSFKLLLGILHQDFYMLYLFLSIYLLPQFHLNSSAATVVG